ncbi:MAG: radical SAM protein [archaeon]
MRPVILDCYTDEPSGLGVPPYLGTYPRYLYGALADKDPIYLTIDDLRAAVLQDKKKNRDPQKTDIKTVNKTRPTEETREILTHTNSMLISGGIQTPGKYLSAVPGTFSEIHRLTAGLSCQKMLVGPAANLGTRLEGGRMQESIPPGTFDAVEPNFMGIEDYDKVDAFAKKGAGILDQIPYPVMVELESGRGCPMRCSFCTEPLKYGIEDREPEPIIDEAKALADHGATHFRFGKATCFYAYGKKDPKRMETMLAGISKMKPETLHIDNANPNNVTDELTKILVRHCTPGNIAAFGVESFDVDVVKANRLNTAPARALEAIRIINKHGATRGENGMHNLLPGVNIIMGLLGETKKTHEENISHLKQVIDEGLLLRRINIRQAVVFEGTYLKENGGLKYLKKNKKHYWRWRNDIRQQIDLPMLERLVPIGTVMKGIRTEVHDGKTTFGRQWGTYPLIVGIKERLPLGETYDVRITGHMLRSVTGEIIR